MSFKYSVIGDNTIENREHLEKFGYDISCPCVRFKTSSLFTDKDGEVHTFQEEELGECLLEIKQGKCDLINCIGNTQLFKAVSAMRDDSDYMQWYYSSDHEKKNWYLSDRHVVKNKDCMINNVRVWHKATLSELQDHFKRV